MMSEEQRDFTTMGVLGLAYTILGIGSVFVFIAGMAGATVPQFLSYNTENSYSILLIGIVNIAAAVGLLKRISYMWSATLMFMIVIFAGNLLGLFYTDVMKYVFVVFTALAVLYMFTTNARLWYGVYEQTQ